MKIIHFVLRQSRGMMALIAMLSIVSSAFNAALIAIMNRVLHAPEGAAAGLAWVFAGLAVARVLTHLLSFTLLAGLTQKLVADMRISLARRIVEVPLRGVERVGRDRLVLALGEDMESIADGIGGLPTVVYNTALLVSAAVYLAWLSWQMLVALGLLAVAGAVIHRVAMRAAFARLRRGREVRDTMYENFGALTNGVKELKLHRGRRRAFLNEGLTASTRSCGEHRVSAEIGFSTAQAWSNLLFFGLVGALLFGWGQGQAAHPEVVSGYVLSVLYLMGPLNALMGSFSYMSRASVALEKLLGLVDLLASGASERPDGRPAPCAFGRIHLRGVTHAYTHERDERHFELGPLDLELVPGELVFVVGGNGSGKSTLGKVLCGLYVPERGQVLLDGVPIDEAGRDAYRQLFSAVFSDFHLFDTLLGLEDADLDETALYFLERLHLDHKVQVRDGRFSTTALSSGQRKRLALLTAYLEDRPVYLFDEWAADQDPQFKDVFYRELLPELAARGKSVVVITHDDHYFSIADRILKLENGQLTTMRDRARYEEAV